MKIKPCSICDFAKPSVSADDTWGMRSYVVYCPKCGESIERTTKKEAVMDWNRVYEEMRDEIAKEEQK